MFLKMELHIVSLIPAGFWIKCEEFVIVSVEVFKHGSKAISIKLWTSALDDRWCPSGLSKDTIGQSTIMPVI